MEDGMLTILTDKLGYKCNLSSADKNREFLKRPKATADIEIEIANGNKIPLELE